MHSISFQVCCPFNNIGQSSNHQTLQIYTTPGPATPVVENGDGIIFSSIYSNDPNQQQHSRPIASQIFNQADTPSVVQTSNVNNALDFGSNYSPFSPPQSLQFQKPENPQSYPSQSYPQQQSSGLTFAPLDSSSTTSPPQQYLLPPPPPPSQTINSTNSHHIHQVRPKPKPKPKPTSSSTSTTTLSPSSSQNHKTQSKKFPTNCGHSKYTNSRIVGGVFTQIGEL